ncbi:hypothetical protein ABT112_00105 [Streptomyces sp. NPDC002055]|uniref:hypothetical protein n=1 Tax=Streptomyces sp. NPDC002055 TaxID=3154534 RepID=UPI00331A4357
MSSPADTAAVREWAFLLHPGVEPTAEQSDQFDHADALAGGEIGWEDGQHGVRFPCVVASPHLEDAVAWAVQRLAALGIPIVRIEMKPFDGCLIQ